MFKWSYSEVWLRRMKEGLQQLGVDIDEVFSQVAIELEAVPGSNDAPARVSYDNHRLLWDTVETVSGDKDIGLHLGEVIPYNPGDLTLYLFLSSDTFGEAINRSREYSRLVSDSIVLTSQSKGDSCSFGFTFRHDDTSELRQINEMLVSMLTRFFAFVTNGDFKAERIEFAHSAPADTQEHQRILGCPVKFDCEQNNLWFSARLLEKECMYAEPATLRMHEGLMNNQLSELDKGDLLRGVKETIAELLDSGEVSLGQVAMHLNVKPGQLRYQLSEMGTNFNQLFSDYRITLAKKLLSETNEPIDQIVYLTGFSEASPFYRAFKRWTGLTPIHYREKYSGDSSNSDDNK
jgi:AraC-like DNA-binding protein